MAPSAPTEVRRAGLGRRGLGAAAPGQRRGLEGRPARPRHEGRLGQRRRPRRPGRRDAGLERARRARRRRPRGDLPGGPAARRAAGGARRRGQQLALDPPEADGTIGGTLAANASGPLRLRYGTARDLVIGITVVLADGTVAKSGGKVVKNVAGYDLGKLFCGSLGTLGLIVAGDVPAAPAAGRAGRRRRRRRVAGRGRRGGAGAPALAARPERHRALAARRPQRGQLAILLRGRAGRASRPRRDTALGLLGRHGPASRGDALPPEAHRRPWDEGDAGLKLRAPTAALPALLAEAADVAERARAAPCASRPTPAAASPTPACAAPSRRRGRGRRGHPRPPPRPARAAPSSCTPPTRCASGSTRSARSATPAR